MNKKYHIITYGCQMNKSDSERIAAELERLGYSPAENTERADLIVVTACSVRQSAIDRIWGLINKIKNQKSKIKISSQNSKVITILTGCVLAQDRRKFAKVFDLILDIKDLPKLGEKLGIKKSQREFKDYFNIIPCYQSPFSALVPIMTGCNNFCAFCAVPYTRGAEISRPAKEILCEVKNLVKKGYKEIWLLGQNVNSYADKIKTQNSKIIKFADLLRMIDKIKGEFWLRFTSPHPKDFSNELINTMAECKKITPYLNLPVQSGDNEILRKMNRPYTIEHYKNLVKKIRKKIPGICLSTDVIVGFPEETKKQFENTAKLFREIKYDMAYISQYSPRPGTTAAKIPDNVPKKEKVRREKELTKILAKTALKKNKKYVGKEIEVLPEEYKNGFLIGKTKTYKTVKLKSAASHISDGRQKLVIKDLPPQTNHSRPEIGKFVKIKIAGATPWGLKGELNHEQKN